MRIIKSIDIRHFRSINEENITDVESLNIFAGANDSGKSNILRALNLFFNQETSFLEPFKFTDDYSKLALLEAREKKKGRQFISIRVTLNENAIRGKTELKRLAKQNGGLWITRDWWNFEGTYRQKIPDFIEAASQGVKRSFSVLLSEIKFIYIPAFKNNEVFSYVISMVADEEGLFIDQDAKTALNEQIAESATDLAVDFTDLTSISTKVSLPFTLDSFWSSLQVATDFESAKIKSAKRGSIDDYLINLVARGEGIKSIFTPIILGWLARMNQKRYWVWGVDEPENSLESSRTVSLYQKFVDYSKHAQIFVSSHSPVFMFPEQSLARGKTRTYITTQETEGNTRFKTIDTTDKALKDSLVEQFGADYGTFLAMQKEYSREMRNAQEERDELKSKLNSIVRPIVFVEGAIDEKYMKQTLKVYRGGVYPADIRWIGTNDVNGQAVFGGDSALKKCEDFLKANPSLLQHKVVLLYDVDTRRQRNQMDELLVMSPVEQSGRQYKTGIEHLLRFPTDFDYGRFIVTETKRKGDKETVVNTPDKKKLCAHVCDEMSHDQQREILAEVNDLLSTIEQFLGE